MFNTIINFLNAPCDVTTEQLIIVFIAGFVCHWVMNLDKRMEK